MSYCGSYSGGLGYGYGGLGCGCGYGYSCYHPLCYRRYWSYGFY
nr:keratin-associated protein 19-7-like [Arvicanthis niloticus]